MLSDCCYVSFRGVFATNVTKFIAKRQKVHTYNKTDCIVTKHYPSLLVRTFEAMNMLNILRGGLDSKYVMNLKLWVPSDL